MAFRTPECALPIQVQKTSVTVNDRVITLRNATMHRQIRYHRYRFDSRPVRRHAASQAPARQTGRIVRTVGLQPADTVDIAPSDTLAAESDTVSTEVKLFVIPKNLDFELQTDFRKVYYEKVTFNDVRGAVDIRNQSVYLKQLSMKGMGSDMNHFHPRLSGQNLRKRDLRFRLPAAQHQHRELVDFCPFLDTIVPRCAFIGRNGRFQWAAAPFLTPP